MANQNHIKTGQRRHLEPALPLQRKQKFRGCSFSGKSFYLDLPANKQTQVLTKAICKLGGIIESFLSRDIHYVVTGNRNVTGHASKGSVATKAGGKSGCQTTDGIESAHCSRGKQLLKKVKHNQECNSVLTNACSWGVSILHVDEIFECIEHLEHRSSTTINNKAAEAKGNGATKGNRKVGKLKKHFLKIEDQRRKFRPLHSTFSNFPEISLKASNRSPFLTIQTPNNAHKEREPCEQEDDEVERRPQNKKRKGYCECCEETYSDLCEHLVSEQHCRYAFDPSHYTIVDGIAAKFAYDFMKLPHRFLAPVDRTKQDLVEGSSGNAGNIVDERLRMEAVQEALVEKKGEQYTCPEAMGNMLEELIREPLQLDNEFTERVHSEDPLSCPVAYTELPLPSVTVEVHAELQVNKTARKLHMSISDDPTREPNLPWIDGALPQLQLGTEALSGFCVEEVTGHLCDATLVISDSIELPLASVIDRSCVESLLGNDTDVQELADNTSVVMLSDYQPIVPMEPLLDAIEMPLAELANSLVLGQLELVTWYQGNVAHPRLTSTLEPFHPLLCTPPPCRNWALPMHSSPQALPSETVKSPHTLEQVGAKTNNRKTKRKFCGSPYPPPAKRVLNTNGSTPSQTVAFPMWIEIWECGLPLPLPLWVDWSKWDSTITMEGVSAGHNLPCLKSSLVVDNISSESDWDVQLPTDEKNSHPTEHYGHLRTAQIDLDESWYGKQLCSVLAHDQSLTTEQCATIMPAS
ncbi:protein DBF4 homolog B [Pelodytes ibericus]